MKKYERSLPANVRYRQLQAGQILLIVVLVMTLALTIGLSVATRTISNLRTSTDEENSQRAFSAAEAGIEQAMQNSTASSGSFTNNTSYETSITSVAGVDIDLNNRIPILKDNVADLWLSTYPGYNFPWDGILTVYWGEPNDVCDADESINTLAAMEIVLISGTKTTPKLTHYPVDPCAARAAVNGFEVTSTGNTTINGHTYFFHKTIAVTDGMLLRVMPLYSSARMVVRGCDAANANCTNLPAQGKIITSVGKADTTQRKLIGFQENPSMPMQILPYILFSPK